MKRIRTKLNFANGSSKTLDNVTLYEGEQYATKIVILFENGQPISGDQLYIEILPKSKDDEIRVFNLTRFNNKYEVILPRIAMERGQLKYTIVRYNDEFNELQKLECKCNRRF